MTDKTTHQQPLTDEQIIAAMPGGIYDSFSDPWDCGVGDQDSSRSIRKDILRVARAVEGLLVNQPAAPQPASSEVDDALNDLPAHLKAHPGVKFLYRAKINAAPQPAPGYCKHCKDYTIESPLFEAPSQEPVGFVVATRWNAADKVTRYEASFRNNAEIKAGDMLYTDPPQPV